MDRFEKETVMILAIDREPSPPALSILAWLDGFPLDSCVQGVRLHPEPSPLDSLEASPIALPDLSFALLFLPRELNSQGTSIAHSNLFGVSLALPSDSSLGAILAPASIPPPLEPFVPIRICFLRSPTGAVRVAPVDSAERYSWTYSADYVEI